MIQISDAAGQILVTNQSRVIGLPTLQLVNLEQLNINAINHWQTAQGIPISAVYFR
ncbi:hypothetical protein J4727_08715 [Providencia rettgeri]|uniref:Uncharacterized protein n=1 Tax=Providencia rettgeri TaxID=587 RepID=A0A939NG66_PRORE|nr:hypothetical protein [Providencia rettgeri]